MNTIEYFNHFATYLAKMNPQAIAQVTAPSDMSDRVEDLVRREKTFGLSRDENTELEKLLALDLLMMLAKARAKKLLLI